MLTQEDLPVGHGHISHVRPGPWARLPDRQGHICHVRPDPWARPPWSHVTCEVRPSARHVWLCSMPQHITETQVGTEKDGRLAEIIVLNYLGACSFSSAETKNQPFLVSFS